MTLAAAPWVGRPHHELAELAREYLLIGHLIDRSGMPHLIARLGREPMQDIAIDEWMGASPTYTKRMQRLLGFEGDTVETIFKGMQLDIGAPPEFLDFRYEVHGDNAGRFHLDHCGALMDVEPMGEEFVNGMCHTIEDPTFDATATAANPRAQVRPIHRPPRTPADRHPHCAWTVQILPDAEDLPVPDQALRLADSNAARLPLASATVGLHDDDGWNDYTADLDPDLLMEHFSSATLSRILDEVALQGQLLTRSYLLATADRIGADVTEVGAHQAAGLAGVATKRLAAALGLAADLDGVADALALSPIALPRAYADLRVARRGDAVVVSLHASPGTDEADGLSWPALLAGPGGDAILHAAAVVLVPTATVTRTDPEDDALATWSITSDPDADPAPQPDDVTLVEFSTGATFQFQRRA